MTAESIGTRGPKLGNLVKQELWSHLGYCREDVIANEAADATYEIGTVLGKVTATGKYVISKSDAVDGSEVPVAIVVEKASLTAATDVTVVVFVRGPLSVAKGALILDATWTGSEQDVYDAFEALGIQTLTQI